MKPFYKYIFIVLIYRNSGDLIALINSLVKMKLTSFKIVVIESFYDDSVHKDLLKLQKLYLFNLIVVENKGYSFGNNQGINYVVKNFSYEFLIVSNSDLIITKIDNIDNHFLQFPNSILGPLIKTKKGKSQNPFIPFRIKFLLKLYYLGFANSNRFIHFASVLLNKLFRYWFILIMFISRKKTMKTYSLHGSFIVFPKSFIDLAVNVFDNNMFLYFEELHLSELSLKFGYSLFVSDLIKITHFEDGSSLSNKSTFHIEKNSYCYFYKNWFLLK